MRGDDARRGQVLVVDDDVEMCHLLARRLGALGFEVAWRTSGAAALELVAGAVEVDAVVTDFAMEGMSGLELCTGVRAERPDLPVILLTAHGSFETAVAALRATIYDVLTKPPDVDALARALDRAVGHRRLQVEVRRLRKAVEAAHGFGELLGTSPPMLRIYDLLSRVAESDTSVLVTGETGTGKELVARALHHQGGRRDGPFVTVNCAAMPHALLESELFGHARGAFTDARTARTGLFVQADRGTLFLDEIGELPLELQPKLLRALQTRIVRPVGADAEVTCDVRFVAATNRSLEEAVAGGSFREDLYFRINVIHVEVPPLRARGRDVLLLAQHFVDRCAAQAGKRVALSAAAAEYLLAHPWPGNVRELQNCMERAVTLAAGEQISVGDLPERMRRHRATVVPPELAADDLVSLATAEDRHIRRVLDAVRGNRARAARILGLDPKTLRRKLAARAPD
jgi:DNA-binding NtrC family response regulator